MVQFFDSQCSCVSLQQLLTDKQKTVYVANL